MDEDFGKKKYIYFAKNLRLIKSKLNKVIMNMIFFQIEKNNLEVCYFEKKDCYQFIIKKIQQEKNVEIFMN